MTLPRLDRTQIAVFAAAALIFAVAVFPLAAAMPLFGLTQAGLSARAARGTVWNGRLSDAQLGRLALGDAQVGLRALPLLIGRAEAVVRAGGGEAVLGVRSGGFSMTGATVTLPARGLVPALPVDTIGVEGARIVFDGGRCRSAAGRARLTFGQDVAGLSLAGGLSGVLRCEGGELVAPLIGQSGMESLVLRIGRGGAYRGRLSVRGADPALAQKLAAAGFTNGPGGLVMTLSGRL